MTSHRGLTLNVAAGVRAELGKWIECARTRSMNVHDAGHPRDGLLAASKVKTKNE
jgi:hypothetical protein